MMVMSKKVRLLIPAFYMDHQVCLKKWVRPHRVHDNIYLRWRWPWDECK